MRCFDLLQIFLPQADVGLCMLGWTGGGGGACKSRDGNSFFRLASLELMSLLSCRSSLIQRGESGNTFLGH